MIKQMWVIRAGEGGKYISNFLQDKYVGLGWDELKSYNNYKNIDEIKNALNTSYPTDNHKIAIWASMIEKFVRVLKIGDYVLSFDKILKLYYLGEILSELQLDTNKSQKNYRKVEWLGYIKKDSLSKETNNTLGAISSLFEVKNEIKQKNILDNLIKNSDNSAIIKLEKVPIPLNSQKDFKERDLHRYLANFLGQEGHWLKVKTIFHEKSLRAEKGGNQWLHPDIVGAQFSFDKYSSSKIPEIQKEIMVQRVTFYSFELKLDLNLSNLREYYFQAVSNSSWANQGYLVYKKKDSNFEVDVEFKKEIFRMHNMFGIGIIALDINNLADSEIIVPAKSKEEIDWLTVDKLTSANSDFAEFLELVKDCLKIDKSNQKGWDETDLE